MESKQVTESLVLASMSHPLRRRMLDVLKVDGASTVKMIAERTGQAGANASHHLKVLAESGLVEPAPELARDQRERWWRLAQDGLSWSSRDFADDPAGLAIASAAQSMSLQRQTDLVRAWWSAPEDERDRWAGASFSTDSWLHLTPAELIELRGRVIELIDSYSHLPEPADGEHRQPVFVFTHGFPAQP